jgi:hypothetical protein
MVQTGNKIHLCDIVPILILCQDASRLQDFIYYSIGIITGMLEDSLPSGIGEVQHIRRMARLTFFLPTYLNNTTAIWMR